MKFIKRGKRETMVLKKIEYGLLIICFFVFALNNSVYADNEIITTYDEDSEFIKQDMEYLELQEKYINSVTAKYRNENEEITWEDNLSILVEHYDELIKEDINIDMVDDYIDIYTAQKECEEIEHFMNKYETNSYQIALAKSLGIKKTPVKYYSNYNRYLAVTYALNHYSNYNSNYPDWTSEGGDCANFVSQCLHYGGIPMVGSSGDSNNKSKWYSYGNTNNTNNVSGTWRAAGWFQEYWMTNSRYYYRYYNYTDAYNVAKIGDVIQLVTSKKVARHTYIVVGKDNSKKDLILACHTSDSKDKRLSETYNLYGGGFILYAIK